MRLSALLILLTVCNVPAVFCPQSSTAEEIPAAVHPWTIYQAADRDTIRAHLHPQGGEWQPKASDKTSRDAVVSSCFWWSNDAYEAKLDGHYRWEGPKAEAMFRLAMIAWLEPAAKRPAWVKASPENATLPGMVRTAVKTISVPKYRVRDYFPDNDDPRGKKGPGPWGRYLDASIALWHYAIAYDLLASPVLAEAGLERQVVDDLYSRLADGAFHLMVRHLTTYDWKAGTAVGNNWNSREMAGVGMACLAMRDRFLAEPAGSQRREDYETGLRLVRRLASLYLKSRDSSREDRGYAYYYEGPHYLCYWAQYFLPFAAAHQRMFPDQTPREMSLAADQPLARFLRGQTLWLMPTMRDRNGKAVWTAPCIDDSWLEADSIAVSALQAAAWIGDQSADDRRLFLAAAKRGGAQGSPLLLGRPVLDELARAEPADLPPVMGLPYGGIGIARTSSAEDALAVLLKNTPTPLDAKTGQVTLDSHSHPDNGEVVAYRDAEAVLIDPGYGASGYSNTRRTRLFLPPEQHNVLMVESPARPGQFALPFFPADDSHPRRLTRSEQVAGPRGPIEVMEAATPAHRRTVILIDAAHLLVVDRLLAPRRARLAWFGNGSTQDRTAEIDAARGQATFQRGPGLAARVTVLLSGGMSAAATPGEYGFEWTRRDHPLTGITVTSNGPITHAVTLVEIRPRKPAAAFVLTAQVRRSPDGSLAITILSAAESRPEAYQIAPDGQVSAGQ